MANTQSERESRTRMSANRESPGRSPAGATGTIHPVAVLGAGPIGLEVALAALQAVLHPEQAAENDFGKAGREVTVNA